MAIFTIADLHLSTLASTNKSMEVFGRRWDHYTERLKANWERVVGEDDTVIVGGDISWALSLEEALSDLTFIDALPGRKILLKGNHDFWWCTMQKHRLFFEAHGIRTISFLFNNAHDVGPYIVAGTRGWFQDDDAPSVNGADAEKIQNRELLRLRTSLSEAVRLREASEDKEREILVFTHFPPLWADREWTPFLDVLEEFGIRRVFFGHIHGQYAIPPVMTARNIEFHLVSADFLDFLPKIIH
ncbi:MAG: metallophosphoesterase [Clostridia bacterium]|nr:metallophosphoesterase [Clostridia bacterium]